MRNSEVDQWSRSREITLLSLTDEQRNKPTSDPQTEDRSYPDLSKKTTAEQGNVRQADGECVKR